MTSPKCSAGAFADSSTKACPRGSHGRRCRYRGVQHMSRTLTAAPTDRSMWRRLLHVVHPDKGGDAELFVWVRNDVS